MHMYVLLQDADKGELKPDERHQQNESTQHKTSLNNLLLD